MRQTEIKVFTKELFITDERQLYILVKSYCDKTVSIIIRRLKRKRTWSRLFREVVECQAHMTLNVHSDFFSASIFKDQKTICSDTSVSSNLLLESLLDQWNKYLEGLLDDRSEDS